MLEAHKAAGKLWWKAPWQAKSWPVFFITAFEYSLYLYCGIWLLHWLKII
jgi:hypothetical protein